MPNPTHITVTAPEGRKTPINPADGNDPSGTLLMVEQGTVCRVRYSQDVRRSIARGDLIPCDMNAAPVTELETAACPKPLEEMIHDGTQFVAGDRVHLGELAEKRKAAAEEQAKLEAEAKAKAAAEASTPPKLDAPSKLPKFDTSDKE